MTKQVEKKVKKPVEKPKKETVKAEVRKPVEKKSIREIVELNAEEVIKDAEGIIAKLKDAETFCKDNGRPFKHYYVFQCQILQFVRVFKKMLR